MQIPIRRLASPRGLVAVMLASVCLVASASQPPAPGQTASTMANFTGGVRSLDGADLRVARFQYEAGARSYWHAHDGLQLLMPESGRLRFQIRGQKIQELGPNQPVYLPAGVAHWHGGTPDQGLTQIAVNMGGVKWMGAVSDDEYLGKVASPR